MDVGAGGVGNARRAPSLVRRRRLDLMIATLARTVRQVSFHSKGKPRGFAAFFIAWPIDMQRAAWNESSVD